MLCFILTRRPRLAISYGLSSASSSRLCAKGDQIFLSFTQQDQKISVHEFTKFLKKLYLQQFTNKMILKINFKGKIHLLNPQDKPSIQELKKALSLIFKSLPSRYALSYIDEDGDQITLNDQQDYQILAASTLKTVKVNVKEINQQFMELTEKIQVEEQISEIEERVQSSNIDHSKLEFSREKVQEIVPQFDDSIIEQKLKKLLPGIISKVKSEISQQLLQRSRLSNEPVIIEQEKAPISFSKMKPEIPIIQESTITVHKGVTCDNCHKRDISGIRYKCAVCSNFDFCEECQATFEHPHPFLKIRNPKQAPVKIFTVIQDQDSNIEVNGHKIEAPPGFQNLVNHGINFISNILQPRGPHPHQRSEGHQERRRHGCPFYRGRCQNRQTEATEKKREEKKSDCKMTEKDVIAEEKRAALEEMNGLVEKKKQGMKQEVIHRTEANLFQEKKVTKQQTILENTEYLASFGFDFNKCHQWAMTYQHLSKEELLQFCLSQQDFLRGL